MKSFYFLNSKIVLLIHFITLYLTNFKTCNAKKQLKPNMPIKLNMKKGNIHDNLESVKIIDDIYLDSEKNINEVNSEYEQSIEKIQFKAKRNKSSNINSNFSKKRNLAEFFTYNSQSNYLTNILTETASPNDDIKRINSKIVFEGEYMYWSEQWSDTLCFYYRKFTDSAASNYYYCHTLDYASETTYTVLSNKQSYSLDYVYFGEGRFLFHVFTNQNNDALQAGFLKFEISTNTIYYIYPNHWNDDITPHQRVSESNLANYTKHHSMLINAVYNCMGTVRAVYSILNIVQ